MKNLVLILFIAGALSFALTSCANTDPTYGSNNNFDVSVTYVGWVVENRASDYSSAPMLIRFFIYLEGDSINYSQINKVVVRSDLGNTCNITIGEGDFDQENQKIDLRLITSSIHSGHQSIPLGNYTFEISLFNGENLNVNRLVPAPGSLTQDGKTVATSEGASFYAGATPNVQLANLGTHTSSSSNVTINFSCNDSLVYSGYVWFYDTATNYVGISKYMRNYVTGNLDSGMGGNFYNNGALNTFVSGEDEISFNGNAQLSDIAFARVILTDGYQYHGTTSGYNSRSISALAPVD